MLNHIKTCVLIRNLQESSIYGSKKYKYVKKNRAVYKYVIFGTFFLQMRKVTFLNNIFTSYDFEEYYTNQSDSIISLHRENWN